MDQISESPLTPLGLQLVGEFAKQRDQQLVPPHRASAAWLFVLLLFGPFFLVDLSFGSIGALNGQLARSPNVLFFGVSMVVAACMGNILVQAVSLSCYAVYSPDGAQLRVFTWLGSTTLLSVTGLLGIYLGLLIDDFPLSDRQYENAIRYFCAMPTIALAAQLPLWGIRVFFQWQFKPHAEAVVEHVSTRRPLSIKHMLVATTLVAVCLGSLRIAPLDTLLEPSEYWLGVAVFSAIAAGASLLGGVWLVWLFARVQNRYYAWSLAIGPPLMIGMILFSIQVWGLAWRQIYRDQLFFFAVFFMIGLSFILGIAASLRLLNVLGWEIGPAHHR